MAKINVLPREVAELIAAGEVVERPASVIKELVENSVDAGSTAVTVEIKSGGVTFMRVTDNGCGIEKQYVATAFLRHATSKIKTGDDLGSIATLGFRGEALAAISSVSRVEMLTKTRDEATGTAYRSSGGNDVSSEEAGCPDGTTIIVRDLFFNTPARMKFLKKDITEGNAVGALLEHIALSHPEISFKFIRDGKQVFSTPGDGKLISAIYAVLGRDFAMSLIPVSGEMGGISVSGYTCKPMACRPKRNAQFVFLNGRYVRSGTVSAALEAAYKNSAMTGRYPAAVLHLTVPYGAVDVNVHPAKTEVRFSDDRRIFDCVMYGVKNALKSGDERPEMRLPQKNVGQIHMTADEYKTAVQTKLPGLKSDSVKIANYEKLINCAAKKAQPEFRSAPMKAGLAIDATVLGAAPEKPEEQKPHLPQNEPVTAEDIGEVTVTYYGDKMKQAGKENAGSFTAEQPENEEALPENITAGAKDNALPDLPDTAGVADGVTGTDDADTDDIRYIGEAFATYIIVQKGESVYLIDKHAAHERMLFNKLKRDDGSTPQLLLTPKRVTLGRDDYSVVTDNIELLEKAGFDLEPFGSNSVLVRAVPSVLADDNIEQLIMEAAASISSKRSIEIERLERLYETMSCRAAVKAGNLSSREELTALAKAVLTTKEIMYCPHGRPVAIELKRREIEKQFGRIQ